MYSDPSPEYPQSEHVTDTPSDNNEAVNIPAPVVAVSHNSDRAAGMAASQ